MDCGQEGYDTASILEQLDRSGNNDYIQIIALLDKTGKHGVVFNERKTKCLTGDAKPLCEFRARNGTRILWFYDRTRRDYVVCTHAFIKKTDGTDRQEIRRGKERMNQYYEWRKANEPQR
jgi:phage-related protein